MIALLRKDLLILRRSRLTVALLVIYPVAVALLIGFAISRTPARPRIAIVNETAPGETVQVGGKRVEVSRYAHELFSQVEAVSAPTRAQAVREVSSAKVLAAVVIPSDIAARVSSATDQAELEVIYNGDALEQSLVSSQLRSALAQANLGFSGQIQRAAAQAIEVLLHGGDLGVLGAPSNLVGLQQIPALLHRVIAHTPPGADRAALERVATFAGFAAQNLSVSKRVLATVGQPIKIHSTLLHGRRTPLDAFAVVVAVTVSLMFLAVLLAAGGVALEREEHVLSRLIRGLVSRETLLLEKGLLAGACSFAVALAMLCGVGAFVSLDWGRIGEWLLALAAGALAFGALGVAIGALAKEVRASSLLAFLLALPLALLALVPAGAVGHGFYDAIGAVSFVFPFKAALQALDAAVNDAGPSLPGSLVHLLGLIVLFGALARAGLRRAA
ncbi:MAG TPA: ABC transporter permease [Solirubrobacteraceae bacterium]|jgi:ABC-2 type transport system permease protein|nr:ABC transporter permease [Solirubrobacteraceae bacterium]